MSNEQSVVDEGTFSVRRHIHIAAPIEKVWQAVTDPAHISQWFGAVALDAKGVGTITWPEHDSIPLRVEQMDEPRMVAYRWNNDDALGSAPTELNVATSTVFTLTLEPTADGTQLTLVETGFDATSDPKGNLEDHRGGWDAELDKLVALLESAA
jgi:uncharacterized protein YndB with AHSA1/START domain